MKKGFKLVWMTMCILLVGVGQTLHAVTATWDGGGGNILWGTSLNWADNEAPAFGDTLDIYFHTVGAGRLTPTQLGLDTITNRTIRSLNYNDNADAAVNIRLFESNLTFDSDNGSASINVSSGAAGNFVIGVAGPGNLVCADNLIVDHAGSGTLEINRHITENFSGATLTKNGTGQLKLSAINTYTGNTIINAGTLMLSATGSISNSASIVIASGATFDTSLRGIDYYALADGQTLSGSGTVNGGLIVGDGAILAPGSSPGILTNAGDLVWSGGGSLIWEVATNSAAGSAGIDWDLLNVTGSFFNQASSGDKFTITIESWDGFVPEVSDTWTILTANDVNGFSADAFLLNDQTGSVGTWSITSDTQSLSLSYAIPEPAVISLMTLVGAGLFIRRRMQA